MANPMTSNSTPTDQGLVTDPQQLSAKPGRTPKGATSDHTLSVQGQKISYRATADWMTLFKKEKPVAEMFYVGYTSEDSHSDRPVTFVFNGGPGAASAYLHVGAVGPRRVKFAPDGTLLPPPARLADNESTWLTFTDLVFIDPIGTGFSRTIDEAPLTGKPGDAPKPPGDDKENEEFFKLNRDLESLGEFITRYLSKHKMWSRPVFIAGESYGGFRVGKLARKLQEGFGVGLNGAILISPALEMSLLSGSDYDILMWSDIFPSLVAASVFHGKSQAFPKGSSLESFLPEVEKFATNEWVRLLAFGPAMPESERNAIFKKASQYLGLPEVYLREKSGRVAHYHYVRQLLKEEKKVVGLYDAAMTAIDPFPDRENFEGADPTLFAIERVFTGGINSHLRETLNVDTDRDYHLLSMKVNTAWKNDTSRHVFDLQIGATDDLRYAMALNPHMKVFITHGVYDLVTPYFASNRLASLMKLTPEQQKNVTLQHFKGGHMFYAWEESRYAFKEAMRNFYSSALTNQH